MPGLENAMILFTTTLDPVGITTMLCFYRRLGLRCDEEGEILVKGLPCDLMCIHTHTSEKPKPQAHFLAAEEAAATKDSSWAPGQITMQSFSCVGLGGLLRSKDLY